MKPGPTSCARDLRSTTNLLGALALALCDEMFEQARESLDLGASATAALLSIGTRPRTGVGALSEVIGREQSSTVRIVDRLEQAGFVVRQPAEDDARRVELRLTERGARAYETLLERRHQVVSRGLENLEDPDLEALHRLVDRILASLVSTHRRARKICRLCDHRVCRGASCPVGRSFADS